MLVIAHRGASKDFPENTLLAFEQAITQQADGIELDVQLHSESEELVVIHDAYVDKTANACGHINSFSLDELLSIPLPSGQYISTLSRVLATINGRCRVNIELKCAQSDAQRLQLWHHSLEHAFDHAFKSAKFKPNQLLVSSFNHPLVAHLSKQGIPASTGALIAHNPLPGALDFEKLGVSHLNIDINCLDPQLVLEAKAQGIKVWVYTVDQPDDIVRCIRNKVDAIITNKPADTLAFINTHLNH